jgi:branched-subunit amino acid ABC-type transport system permease component
MSFRSLLRVWLILLPAMIANGVFRELVLRSAIGPLAAGAMSAVLGIVIVLALTRLLLRPLAGAPAATLARASFTLLALTVVFEFLFGHYVDRKSWSALVENYFLWRGNLWPLVLATLAITPFLWGRGAPREPHHVR